MAVRRKTSFPALSRCGETAPARGEGADRSCSAAHLSASRSPVRRAAQVADQAGSILRLRMEACPLARQRPRFRLRACLLDFHGKVRPPGDCGGLAGAGTISLRLRRPDPVAGADRSRFVRFLNRRSFRPAWQDARSAPRSPASPAAPRAGLADSGRVSDHGPSFWISTVKFACRVLVAAFRAQGPFPARRWHRNPGGGAGSTPSLTASRRPLACEGPFWTNRSGKTRAPWRDARTRSRGYVLPAPGKAQE